MPDEPPSILPRGTIIRPSASPRPQPPGSPVSIQSVSGSSCSVATAAGISSAGGGGPPAPPSATRTDGSSDNRAATTAPADPPPTTTTSNCSAIWHLPGSARSGGRFVGRRRRERRSLARTGAGCAAPDRPPRVRFGRRSSAPVGARREQVEQRRGVGLGRVGPVEAAGRAVDPEGDPVAVAGRREPGEGVAEQLAELVLGGNPQGLGLVDRVQRPLRRAVEADDRP